jgi:hypothetical protein
LGPSRATANLPGWQGAVVFFDAFPEARKVHRSSAWISLTATIPHTTSAWERSRLPRAASGHDLQRSRARPTLLVQCTFS